MKDNNREVWKLLGLEVTLREHDALVNKGEVPYYEQVPLHFGCTGCGRCCTRPGVVYLHAKDRERLSLFLGVSVAELCDNFLERDEHGEWVARVEAQRPCPFLEGEACGVYEARPEQCRTYPFWPELVDQEDSWKEEAEHCPGIHQGRAYKPTEIRRLMWGIGETK